MVDDVTSLNLAMAEEMAYALSAPDRDMNWHLGCLAENAGTSSQNRIQGHAIDSVLTAAAASIPKANLEASLL